MTTLLSLRYLLLALLLGCASLFIYLTVARDA